MRKKNLKLSLCMVGIIDDFDVEKIVNLKNKIVDEIIIVNTAASKIKTQLVNHYGINVYKFNFNSDFSEAKNIAIDNANGKWILFLEPGELLSIDEAKKIPPLLDNPMVEGYLLNIKTEKHLNSEFNDVQSLRLFRNRKEYRYKYKVYEKIPDELITSVKDANVIINFNPNFLKYNQNKKLRTSLLKTVIKENPEDGYLNYVYGIDLINNNKYYEGINQFEIAQKKVDYYHVFCPHLYALLTTSYMKVNSYENAFKSVNQGINLFPNNFNLYYLRGRIHMQNNNTNKAIEDYHICLNKKITFDYEDKIHSKVYLALGEAYEESLNFDMALNYFSKAYEDHRNIEAIYKIGHLFAKNPLLGNIDTALLKYLNLTKIENVFILVDILCLEKKYQEALNFLEKIDSNPDIITDISFFKGICYMMLGDIEKAEYYYSLIQCKHNYYSLALQKRIQNYWYNNRPEAANRLIIELNTLQNIKQSIKNLYCYIHNVLTDNKNVIHKLCEEEYEILAKITEHMLWVSKNDKVEILLECLLISENEEWWFNISEIYADKGDIKKVKKILSHVSHEEVRIKMIGKAAKCFYENGKINEATHLLQKLCLERLDLRSVWVWEQIHKIKTEKLIDFGLDNLDLDEKYKTYLLSLKETLYFENQLMYDYKK